MPLESLPSHETISYKQHFTLLSIVNTEKGGRKTSPLTCRLCMLCACEKPTMPRQFEFVTVSNPSAPASSEDRRLTYSAAMRQAHAKRRRFQVQKYREESVNKDPITRQKVEIFALSSSSLPKPLPGNGMDPFSSLERPLSSEEYFLLHHCR